MLTQFPRSNGEDMLIDPDVAYAAFPSAENPNVTVVRMPDGRGFALAVRFADIKPMLVESGMVEFQRDQEDEDEIPLPIMLRAKGLSSVFASASPGRVIVRGYDGRGLIVRGAFREVVERLGYHVEPAQDTPALTFRGDEPASSPDFSDDHDDNED